MLHVLPWTFPCFPAMALEIEWVWKEHRCQWFPRDSSTWAWFRVREAGVGDWCADYCHTPLQPICLCADPPSTNCACALFLLSFPLFDHSPALLSFILNTDGLITSLYRRDSNTPIWRKLDTTDGQEKGCWFRTHQNLGPPNFTHKPHSVKSPVLSSSPCDGDNGHCWVWIWNVFASANSFQFHRNIHSKVQ